MFQKSVSRDVVMGGIKADIFREKPVSIASKFVYSIEKVFTVMPFSGCKFEQEWEIQFQLIISATQKIQGVSEIPGFVAAVPSPMCIRVGIMPVAIFPVSAGSWT